ncbi:MAG: type II toxin-antitoxin system PemK/MazF family toxin [Candidatus Nanohalobium sp.]
MKVKQGDVIIGPDFIGGSSRRPFVVISNEEHPFDDEECLVVLITTTEREEALPLPEEKFEGGKLPKESYASPWTITTLKTNVIQKKVGKLETKALEEITGQATEYIQ